MSTSPVRIQLSGAWALLCLGTLKQTEKAAASHFSYRQEHQTTNRALFNSWLLGNLSNKKSVCGSILLQMYLDLCISKSRLQEVYS